MGVFLQLFIPNLKLLGWVLLKKSCNKKALTYKKGIFPFTANARAKTTGDTEGNIKVLSHPKNDKIIAVHIIGAHAGELIGEAATAMEAGLSAEDIALICHAHPTLSESMKEAASLSIYWKNFAFLESLILKLIFALG